MAKNLEVQEKKVDARELAEIFTRLPQENKQVLYGFALGMIMNTQLSGAGKECRPKATV